MRRIFILFLLTCSIAKGGITPAIGTNDVWVTPNLVYGIYDALSERLWASPFKEIAIGDSWTKYNLPTSNLPWVQNIAQRTTTSQPFNYFFDPYLFAAMHYYLALTNGETNTTSWEGGTNALAFTNWTEQTAFEYLSNNFVNIDGTVGVGVLACDPDVGTTNWYLTQTWTTNWDLCLGTLTFAPTNSFINTNGVLSFGCAWLFQDGDRIVRLRNNPPDISPWDQNSQWWNDGSTYGAVGATFHWADYSKINAHLSMGAWLNTNGAAGFVGLTKLYFSVGDTNPIDVSGLTTDSTIALPSNTWDIGDMRSSSNADIASFVVTNTLNFGDKIVATLHVGTRLYQYPYYAPGVTWIPGGRSPRPTWLKREALNERAAILSIMRASDVTGWTGSGLWIPGSGTERTNRYVGDGSTNHYANSTLGYANSKSIAEATKSGSAAANLPWAYTTAQFRYSDWYGAHTRWWDAHIDRRNTWFKAAPSSNSAGTVHLLFRPVKSQFGAAHYAAYYTSPIELNFWDANGESFAENTWMTYGSETFSQTNLTHVLVGSAPSITPAWAPDPTDYTITPAGIVFPYDDPRVKFSRGWMTAGWSEIIFWSFTHCTNGL